MLVARATLRAAAAARTAALSRSRRASVLVSRRTRCAMAAPAAPLRVTFVTGNKKKLEEVRDTRAALRDAHATTAQHASHCFGVLTSSPPPPLPPLPSPGDCHSRHRARAPLRAGLRQPGPA
jgi:hypothetical protein